ncbi:unnamed protein product [marine sediment metagenome]|uniref:Uncharacterized protein n=1 Tax=marine sediment metagenome TaxID=412755 RepID=X0WLD4_9ZZZZ
MSIHLVRQKAGIARMNGMTPAERRELALKGAAARWGNDPPESRPTYRPRQHRALMEQATEIERRFLQGEIDYEEFIAELEGIGCEIDYDKGELVRKKQT